MEDNQEIAIGDAVFRRQDLFEGEERARGDRARFSFEEKIRILVQLQKLARDWGRRKDIIIWEMT